MLQGRNQMTARPHTGIYTVPGLFVPKIFRSQERIVPMGNFRSQDFSFPGTFVPWKRKFLGTFVRWERKFLGTFVPWNFRSEELLFLRLFYKALAMNADTYSNCQNLFRRRPSSISFQASCAPCHSHRHIKDREMGGESGSTYVQR